MWTRAVTQVGSMEDGKGFSGRAATLAFLLYCASAAAWTVAVGSMWVAVFTVTMGAFAAIGAGRSRPALVALASQAFLIGALAAAVTFMHLRR